MLCTWTTSVPSMWNTRYASRRTEIQSIHQPLFFSQDWSPLDNMVRDRKFVYNPMFGFKNFFRDISWRLERACCIRLKKLLKIAIQVGFKANYFTPTPFPIWESPVGFFKVLRRSDILWYVSFTFHTAVSLRCRGRFRLLFFFSTFNRTNVRLPVLLHCVFFTMGCGLVSF